MPRTQRSKGKARSSRNKMGKACRNKKKYSSKESALKRANALYRAGIQLKPYQCGVCKGWHLCKIHRKSRLNYAFIEAGLEPVFK